MPSLAHTYLKTPLGITCIEGDTRGVSKIYCIDDNLLPTDDTLLSDHPVMQCKTQLKAYFKGDLKVFSVKVNPEGTAFQKRVWKSLLEISYGQTISYLDQAKRLGDIKAIRAVASANGKNPLWIVLPCHRVIGSDGSLTGYAGGLWRKRWLLEHEGAIEQQLELF